MDLPATSDTWVWQENARLPSICTMQAPHSPAPQPNLVPVSFNSSRMTQSSGVSGSASDETDLALTVKRVAIGEPPSHPEPPINGPASDDPGKECAHLKRWAMFHPF